MNKGQAKRHSIIEAFLNVFTGMLIGFTLSHLAHIYQDVIRMYIWSGFVWNLTVGSNVLVTTVLTIASLIRSYIWRRIFNKIQLGNYRRKGRN